MLMSMGARNPVTLVISADTTSYTLNTGKITSGYQAGNTDVTLIINSGYFVGSTALTAALSVDTSWASGDTVTIINNGYIVGKGGDANSGAGGLALSVSSG